jgi:hypothetical protein
MATFFLLLFIAMSIAFWVGLYFAAFSPGFGILTYRWLDSTLLGSFAGVGSIILAFTLVQYYEAGFNKPPPSS